MDEELDRKLRSLPSVDRVMGDLEGPRPLAADAARRAIDRARSGLKAGEEWSEEAVVAAAVRDMAELLGALLRPLVNATGVLIHTNLGRVPLGRAQLDAVVKAAGSYSNLEYDVARGVRGSRYQHAKELLQTLLDCEDALVVNNNAAAVLLVASCLAKGREIIVSRGELVEIGGGFRIPEVIEASGARLVEVGSTNRTHLSDYERAISGETGFMMKVHPSNFRLTGFTKEVAARDLARLARGRGICFVHDLGSGLIEDVPQVPLGDEPVAATAISEGADLVTFSGDKLLGGPQAGVIAGSRSLIAELEKHPLTRAVRVDKMTLAALETTLLLHLEDRRSELPLWSMATVPLDRLEERAVRLAAELSGMERVKAEATTCTSVMGGGSTPGEEIPSWGVWLSVEGHRGTRLATALRKHDPPVIARLEDGRLAFDLRTVAPEQDHVILDAIRAWERRERLGLEPDGSQD